MPKSLKQQIAPTIEAFKIYWPAILAIQICALFVLLAYYFVDGAEAFFIQVADWKERGGVAFAAIATVVSAGILSEAFKRSLRKPNQSTPSNRELLHQLVMWAGIGILVDWFYQVQSRLFGDTTDIGTLVIKVLCDQLIFTPLISLPFVVIWMLLYEKRYNLRAWSAAIRLPLLSERVLQLWATVLSFWPVMLCIIYSLPGNLQFPLFLFANSAFGILMIFVARRQTMAEKTSTEEISSSYS
jgi:hypothetical protein